MEVRNFINGQWVPAVDGQTAKEHQSWQSKRYSRHVSGFDRSRCRTGGASSSRSS